MTKTCSLPDCDKAHCGNGYCKNHNRLFKKYGKPEAPSYSDRFWAKVDKNGPVTDPALGNCWVWTATQSAKGYGQVASPDRSGTLAISSRVSWEMANGAIPRGLYVLHYCDNPPCVRPDHLWLGTPYDNMQDMIDKGRAGRNQGGDSCVQGHPFDEANTGRHKTTGQRWCRACARIRGRVKRAIQLAA